MKYSQVKKLSSTKFKRLTGVKRGTFSVMVRVVKTEEKKKKKVGRPAKLRIEDQILITLQYLREYRAYYQIGIDWKLSESAICRLVHKIENILIRSRKFSLPGKKELLKTPIFLPPPTGVSGGQCEQREVVMDVMESPIERPKKGQKTFYSGKQKEHTLKTQVIIDQKTLKIICLSYGKGKVHDFQLFKASGVKLEKSHLMIADKGYQGIAKIHELSETPIKKKKGQKLTKEEKQYNRQLNRRRVVVEHVNRRLKIFRILSSPYRNRHRRFGLRVNLIAGIYNYELEAKA